CRRHHNTSKTTTTTARAIAVQKRIVPKGMWSVEEFVAAGGEANVAAGRLGAGASTGLAWKLGTHRGPLKCAPPSAPAATTTTAPSAMHHASARRDIRATPAR